MNKQELANIKANLLREVVKLHGFDSGEFGDVVSCEDLLALASDLEAGIFDKGE